MATISNYDIKRAFIAGAKVKAEYPHVPALQCVPRGEAGDRACVIWWDAIQETRDKSGVAAVPVGFDMVLFMLFLGERAVRP